MFKVHTVLFVLIFNYRKARIYENLRKKTILTRVLNFLCKEIVKYSQTRLNIFLGFGHVRTSTLTRLSKGTFCICSMIVHYRWTCRARSKLIALRKPSTREWKFNWYIYSFFLVPSFVWCKSTRRLYGFN